MARVAVAVALIVAAAALGDVPDTHDWFVVERGVMSDVGEGVQAGKPPLVPGMLVTLRGGSGNHHCGDASGGTACNHQAPTKVCSTRTLLPLCADLSEPAPGAGA